MSVSKIFLPLLLLGASATVSVAQDLPIPRPSGEFGVGTTAWHWADPDRPDDVTADPNDVREVMAQIWYPTDVPAAAPTNFYAPLNRNITQAKGWSLPGRPFTTAIEKAPVIALCPGFGTARYHYSTLAEDLASHGYVVFGVDYPHVGFPIYPDGRSVIPTLFPPLELQSVPYAEGIDRFLERPGALGTGDMEFALRKLEEISKKDPAGRLTGRLDWKRLGAFAHSLGARACGGVVHNAHKKFAAFASMEGAVSRTVRPEGLDVPVMMLLGSFLPQPIRQTIRDIVPTRGHDAYVITLSTFNHNSLNDLPYLDPLRYPSVVNPIFALEQGREVVRTFFDQYVKETGADTRDLAQLPLTTVEYYPKPEH